MGLPLPKRWIPKCESQQQEALKLPFPDNPETWDPTLQEDTTYFTGGFRVLICPKPYAPKPFRTAQESLRPVNTQGIRLTLWLSNLLVILVVILNINLAAALLVAYFNLYRGSVTVLATRIVTLIIMLIVILIIP